MTTHFDKLSKDMLDVLFKRIDNSISDYVNEKVWAYYLYDWDKCQDEFSDMKFIVADCEENAIKKILKAHIDIVLHPKNQYLVGIPILDAKLFPGIYEEIFKNKEIFENLFDAFIDLVVKNPYRPQLRKHIFKLRKIEIDC